MAQSDLRMSIFLCQCQRFCSEIIVQVIELPKLVLV